MSNRDLAKSLIDRRSLHATGAVIPDEAPKPFYILAAFSKLDNGGGKSFGGTTDQLFAKLMEE